MFTLLIPTLFLHLHFMLLCRIINFYKATLNIPFLEVVHIRDDTTKRGELRLNVTPVGIANSVNTIDDLCIAMFYVVHCVFKIHECGWSIVDLSWPNIIEEGGSFHIY